MAVTITPITRAFSLGGTRRGQKLRAFQFSADASKPDAGYVMAATDIGMSSVDLVIVQSPDPLYAAKFAVAADLASGTLQYYVATESAVSLVGSGASSSDTNISVIPVQMLVVGR